jgi:hypothetical protein
LVILLAALEIVTLIILFLVKSKHKKLKNKIDRSNSSDFEIDIEE